MIATTIEVGAGAAVGLFAALGLMVLVCVIGLVRWYEGRRP